MEKRYSSNLASLYHFFHVLIFRVIYIGNLLSRTYHLYIDAFPVMRFVCTWFKFHYIVPNWRIFICWYCTNIYYIHSTIHCITYSIHKRSCARPHFFSLDLFQLNISNFYMRALISVHSKVASQLSWSMLLQLSYCNSL